MQLVMRRHRLERGRKPFKINARMVLYEDEKALLDRYSLHNVVLTPGHRGRDIRKAIVFAIIPALLIAGIIANFIPPPLGIEDRLTIVVLCFIILTYLIYHQIREEVIVKDLLTGRDFKARSFLDLLLKEQMIRKAAAVFQKVVDQARTWHEPEVIELQEQPLPTVLEGYREAA